MTNTQGEQEEKSLLREFVDGVKCDQEKPTEHVTLEPAFDEAISFDVCAFEVPRELEDAWRIPDGLLLTPKYKLADPAAVTVTFRNFAKRSVAKCINYHVPNEDVIAKAIFKFAAVSATNRLVSCTMCFFVCCFDVDKCS